VLHVAAGARKPAHEQGVAERHPAAMRAGLEPRLVDRAAMGGGIEVQAGPAEVCGHRKAPDLLFVAALSALTAQRLPAGPPLGLETAQAAKRHCSPLLRLSAHTIQSGTRRPASRSRTGHSMIQRARKMPRR